MIGMDPQLAAFISLLPKEDLNDPVADRRDSAERAAARPALDTGDMELEYRMVPAAPTCPCGSIAHAMPKVPSFGCTAAGS